MPILPEHLAQGRVGHPIFLALALIVGAGLVVLFVRDPTLPMMGAYSWPLVWAWLWLLSARLTDAGWSLWRLAAPIAGTILACVSALMSIAMAMAGWEAGTIALMTLAALLAGGFWALFLWRLARAPSVWSDPAPVDYDRFAYGVTALSLCALIAGALSTFILTFSWVMALLIWALFRVIALRLRDAGLPRLMVLLPIAVSVAAAAWRWKQPQTGNDPVTWLLWLAAAPAVPWALFLLALAVIPPAKARKPPAGAPSRP